MFQIETISAKMLDYYVERSDAVIIDLRDPVSYKKGHVRNAVNIPYHELEEYLEKKREQKYQVRSVTSIEGDYECMTGNGLCLYFKGNHDNVKNRNKNDTNHKEKRL